MSGLIPTGIRRILAKDQRSGLERGHRRAEVIAVCAQKGGVGKTTTAVNLAAGLATNHGKKVLLIDMDGQGHCAAALHAELQGVVGDSLTGVLLGKRRDVLELALPTKIPGLSVVPSDKTLGATEGVMAGRIGKEFLLKGAMKIARTHFDVVIIDCPPNLGTLTTNALLAADWLLVPCDMSTLSVEGVDDIFHTIETIEDALDHHIHVLGILRTRYDGRNQKVNEAVEATLERFARHVLPQRIPINTTLAQAQLAGTSVGRFDPRSSGAVAYNDLADEVVTRIADRA